MRILLIEPCHRGFGGYFRAINIARSLAGLGNEVILLYSSPSSLFVKKIREESLTIYELPRVNINFFLNLRILRGLIACYFVLFSRYEVVHTFVPVQLESNIPTLFAKLIRKKVVMDWDDYWTGSDIYGNFRIMKMYVSYCEKIFPRLVNNFVVVSDFLALKAEEYGAVNVIKIINGINNVKESDGLPKNLQTIQSPRLKLVFVLGNTFMRERASQLLKFIDNTIELDTSFAFITNANINTIQREAFLYDQYEFVHKTAITSVGYIPESQLFHYFKKTGFSLFLSGNYDAERANYPIRIGTYISGGNPIVMNDINSEANSTVKNYGLGLINSDLGELSANLVKLSNDQKEYDKYSINFRDAIESLSWKASADALQDYYIKCK